VLRGLTESRDPRLIVGIEGNEDAAVVEFPGGKALVQTVDFFTPIVNDPYWFGQIAAANALSDVYAMGGEPLAAMNIVCFPIKTLPKAVLRGSLEGGRDKLLEAGAVLAGGPTIEDDQIKYGLAVSGWIDPLSIATNKGLTPGDQLILTKPLGAGVLATALKANWEGAELMERLLYDTAGRLNKNAGRVIQRLSLKAATDITGFGLGGHLLEMIAASRGVRAEIRTQDVPFQTPAVDLASQGRIPAGSYANRNFCQGAVRVAEGGDPIMADLIFDAQTSGGLLLAVPEKLLPQARALLADAGDLAAHVGEVLLRSEGEPRLLIR